MHGLGTDHEFLYFNVVLNVFSTFEPNLGEHVSPPYPVAYLGFHKGEPNFLWPVMLTQRGQTMFSNFFPMSKKNFFAKGGHGSMVQPPLQGTIWGVAIIIETTFIVILSDSQKSMLFRNFLVGRPAVPK